jgi:hypothetical protein
MSKYEVNKVMRSVVLMTIEEFENYKQDRSAMLEGHDLTGEERVALINVDYVSLYASGAHPFLLNGFTFRAWPGDRAQLRKEFGVNIEPFGYPDIST